MGMILHLNAKGNMGLVKHEETRTYVLAWWDNDNSRRVIWNKDNHKALTEWADKVFKG